jgi:uncharacterized membrane protein YphA (DoxX/SURF4 family)
LANPILPNRANVIKEFFRKGLVRPWPYRIVRLALAALFIYAGVIKLFDPQAFAAIISSYDLVPEALLPVFAVGLPVIETAAGLALVFDRPWGLHLVTVMLVFFVLVLGNGILGIWMSIAAVSGRRTWIDGPVCGRPFIAI